jgi:hypothetical protein
MSSVRVRCVRLFDAFGPKYGEPIEPHPGVAIGDEFVVLSILVNDNIWRVMLQLLRADGERSWFPAAMFETTSSAIPSNWVAQIWADGSLHLSPEAWLQRGFYEGYIDGERNGRRAREIYETELATILAES